MWLQEIEVRWQQSTEEVLIGIKEWRLQHPRATLREIEEALDERWAKARARMLQDIALASDATGVSDAKGVDGPRCPQCGQTLEWRGQDTRSLSTYYNQSVTLKRSYALCPACGTGLFPPG